MSSPARRPNYTPRRKREQRAFLATMVGGGAAVIAVVGALLAIVGVIGGTIPFIALIVAVVSYFIFRGSTRR
jgi:uncharacterized membrane protein